MHLFVLRHSSSSADCECVGTHDGGALRVLGFFRHLYPGLIELRVAETFNLLFTDVGLGRDSFGSVVHLGRP